MLLLAQSFSWQDCLSTDSRAACCLRSELQLGGVHYPQDFCSDYAGHASALLQLFRSPMPLVCAASRALSQSIGERSGLIGMVVQIGRDLYQACEENSDLKAALDGVQSWRKLWSMSNDTQAASEGPMAQLVSKQQGSLAGGKPSALGMQGMYEDECRTANIPLQALLGIREFAQMHQSLNLGVPLQ
jgi:hypothetical protein